MALHLQFRPNRGEEEPKPHGKMASMRKLKTEAYLAEVMDLLGWCIKTRAFTVALPNEKYTAWRHQIKEMITMNKAPNKELSQLVSRLNHVHFIIPSSQHFMN